MSRAVVLPPLPGMARWSNQLRTISPPASRRGGSQTPVAGTPPRGVGKRAGSTGQRRYDTGTPRIRVPSDMAGWAADLQKKTEECVSKGRYDEAEQVVLQAVKMREEEERTLYYNLLAWQDAYVEAMDSAHNAEIQHFEQAWSVSLKQYDQQAEDLREQQETRMRREYVEFKSKLIVEMEPRTPRWSKTLLETRMIELRLTKQERFTEAAMMKATADSMQQREEDEWLQRRDERIQAAEDLFLSRQRMERNGLRKRVATGRCEFETARSNELRIITSRYQNTKAQVQSQQKITATFAERNPLVHVPKGVLQVHWNLREEAATGAA